MNEFALHSHVVFDQLPEVISSAAANATSTPTELRLSVGDLGKLSNLDCMLRAILQLSSSDTVTVTVELEKVDYAGAVTTIDTLTLAITAGTRAEGSLFIPAVVSGFRSDEFLQITTTTTVLGTATYQVFPVIEFLHPFSVKK